MLERPEIPSGCTDCAMELLPCCAEPRVRLFRTHPVVVPEGTIPCNMLAGGADDCAVVDQVNFFGIYPKKLSRVSPIYRHLQQIFQDLDIHTRSSPGLMKSKTT